MTTRSALLVSLACVGCYHTVTVLVPARDVPARTVIVASVSSGHVEQYEPGTRIVRGRDIVHAGEVTSHVDGSDLLAIEASGGERFGRTTVTRADWGNAVALLGGILLVGGALASWIFAGVCASDASQSGFFAAAGGICFGFGFLGTAGAALIGGPFLAFGVHGELRAEPIRVSVAPNGLVLRF